MPSMELEMDLGSVPRPVGANGLTWCWYWLLWCRWWWLPWPLWLLPWPQLEPWMWEEYSFWDLPFTAPGRLITESRREPGGERSWGFGRVVNFGEHLREFGGVRREPPRRTWQVGQILTKREISSFGTLFPYTGLVYCSFFTLYLAHLLIIIIISSSSNSSIVIAICLPIFLVIASFLLGPTRNKHTKNTSSEPELRFCLGLHVGIAGVLLSKFWTVSPE